MLRSKSQITYRLSAQLSTPSAVSSHSTAESTSSCAKRSAIASILLATGVFYVGLPTPSAQANFWWINTNEYEECAADLVGLDLTEAAIADACASALHPDSLSACVTRISKETAVIPAKALAGCRRDRRPEDMAECVVDIDQNTDGQYGDAALDYCRRSLLPISFSDCVVGLRSEIDVLEPLPAMDVCIAADDRPVEYLPDFVYPQPEIVIPQLTSPSNIAPSTTLTPLQPAQPAPAPAPEPVPALF